MTGGASRGAELVRRRLSNFRHSGKEGESGSTLTVLPCRTPRLVKTLPPLPSVPGGRGDAAISLDDENGLRPRIE